MSYGSRLFVALFAVGALVSEPGVARADSASVVLRQMTSEGRIKQGILSFEERVKDDPKDQEARFALGILKFLQAVEGLVADQYRFGLGSDIRQQVRLPLFHEVLENPKPQKVAMRTCGPCSSSSPRDSRRRNGRSRRSTRPT